MCSLLSAHNKLDATVPDQIADVETVLPGHP